MRHGPVAHPPPRPVHAASTALRRTPPPHLYIALRNARRVSIGASPIRARCGAACVGLLLIFAGVGTGLATELPHHWGARPNSTQRRCLRKGEESHFMYYTQSRVGGGPMM